MLSSHTFFITSMIYAVARKRKSNFYQRPNARAAPCSALGATQRVRFFIKLPLASRVMIDLKWRAATSARRRVSAAFCCCARLYALAWSYNLSGVSSEALASVALLRQYNNMKRGARATHLPPLDTNASISTHICRTDKLRYLYD